MNVVNQLPLFFRFFCLFVLEVLAGSPYHIACRILVPPSGIEPVPPVETQSLSHWTTREVPLTNWLFFFFLNFTILYRNSTGLFEWAQCNHKGIKWGKWEAGESKTSRWHHMAIFGFENGERFWARECRKPLEAHKGKIKYNSPQLEPSEGSTALPTLWF